MVYIYTLDELISSIKDIEQTTKQLELYIGHDWMYKICKIDEGEYNKISIYNSDLFDVYLIYWGKNSITYYHDHAKYGCVMKVLYGELIEDRKDITNNIQISTLNKGEISMIKNSDGIHRISSKCSLSASLHIYFPGNHSTNYYSNDSSVVLESNGVGGGIVVDEGDVVLVNSTCSDCGGGGATADNEPII